MQASKIPMKGHESDKRKMRPEERPQHKRRKPERKNFEEKRNHLN
jgi:hypothetical protein